jgi:hypothetical protein
MFVRAELERETGFEPATSTLARSHSTTELFPLTRTHTVPHGPATFNPGASGIGQAPAGLSSLLSWSSPRTGPESDPRVAQHPGGFLW